MGGFNPIPLPDPAREAIRILIAQVERMEIEGKDQQRVLDAVELLQKELTLLDRREEAR